MKVKDGVLLSGLNIKMRPVLIAADKVWSEYGHELVITSTNDGVHSPGSLHYYGYAVDLRTHYFDAETVRKVHRDLSLHLHQKGFVVILHSTHIHVEYRRIFDEIGT